MYCSLKDLLCSTKYQDVSVHAVFLAGIEALRVTDTFNIKQGGDEITLKMRDVKATGYMKKEVKSQSWLKQELELPLTFTAKQ